MGPRRRVLGGRADRPARRQHAGIFETICTDQVRFCRDGAPVPLEEVPPLTFSEAMRDVDLFVGVCSLGNDPTWPNRGPAEYGPYWQTVRRGRTVGVRKNAPRRAGRADPAAQDCQQALTGGSVSRRAWRSCDLSDSSRLEQRADGAWEPISLHRSRTRRSVRNRDTASLLPFEGDHGLSIILSKALLLAADATITDPLIVRQIRPA